MPDKSISEILMNLPLFSGVDQNILDRAVEGGKFIRRSFAVGEVIFSPERDEKKLTFFLSGEAEVHSIDENRAVILRTLSKGSIVGVANLFSNERYVSRVVATKRGDTVEISAEDYGKILESDKRAMYNYISFLSNRICYLNKKIVCLTAGSSERRLAYYLDSALTEKSERGNHENTVTVQMNTLCEMLNLGRASLYRAADKLCDEGFISRSGKTFTVNDREGMIEKYK